MRILVGTAVSTKMAKTVVVRVDRLKPHPKYGKNLKVTDRYYAHDPEGRVKLGDTVHLLESRPLSKLKRWIVITPERAAALQKVRATAHTERERAATTPAA